MWGLTETETWLTAALGLVVTVSALILSYMVEEHQRRRDDDRRERRIARARARRLRGVTVRPKA